MFTYRAKIKSTERSSEKKQTVVTVTREVHTILSTSNQPQKIQVKSLLSAKDKKKSASSGFLFKLSAKKEMDNKTYTDKAHTTLYSMNNVFYPAKPINYQTVLNKDTKTNMFDKKKVLSGASNSSYVSPYSGKRIDYVQPRETKVSYLNGLKPKPLTNQIPIASPAYQSPLTILPTPKSNQIPSFHSLSNPAYLRPSPNRITIYPSASQSSKSSSLTYPKLSNQPTTTPVSLRPPCPLPKPKLSNQHPKIRSIMLPEINKLKLSSARTHPRHPGVAYIFNHEIFDNPENEKREGSNVDVKMLNKTFSHFKLDVKIYTNLTVKGIKAAVTKIEDKNFSTNSCIVITILSHGNRLERIAAKDGSYSIDDDVLFPILRNKTLESKPKIFIIQACKGDVDLRDYKTDSAKPEGNPSEVMKCYSTFEGYVSYRSVRGSIFVQTLCELLQQYGAKKDFMEIMQMCIREVKSRTNDLQIPTMSTTITMPYMFGDYM